MKETAMKPHPHADVIKAWADGHTVQMLCGHEWRDLTVESPAWNKAFDYRVKPAEPEVSYPSCEMNQDEVIAAWTPPYGWKGLRDFGDKVLRHACDNGQIVSREEFDRAVGDRRARDLAVAKAVRDSFMWIRVPITVDRFDDEYLQKVIEGVTQ